MSKLILQHWSGPMNELTERSIESIKQYAKLCNADYRLLEGDVFRKGWAGQSQKLAMLHEEFDEYEQVCMLDADMFVKKGNTDNVFDLKGIGMCEPVHANIRQRLSRTHPLCRSDCSYWGGAIYNMNRDVRQALREQIVDQHISMFANSAPHDEGMMFVLASKAGIKDQHYIDPVWCHSSFFPDHSKAKLIHIRTKITPSGPKRTKLENLNALVENGDI